ncbi:MAG: hypothetical protein JWR43_1674, partial [Phenylobacterium sp.]|nr:hypothetical protein [Phenylobacterium sp.]
MSARALIAKKALQVPHRATSNMPTAIIALATKPRIGLSWDSVMLIIRLLRRRLPVAGESPV